MNLARIADRGREEHWGREVYSAAPTTQPYRIYTAENLCIISQPVWSAHAARAAPEHGHDHSKPLTPSDVERTWAKVSGRDKYATMSKEEQLAEVRKALYPGLPPDQERAALSAFRNHCTRPVPHHSFRECISPRP